MRIKERKKTLPVVAAVILFCIACGALLFPAAAETAQTAAGNRKTLYDFETEYDRASIDSGYIFGTIKRSDAHVTSGDKSLYLEISGRCDEDNELHYAGSDHWGGACSRRGKSACSIST